MLDITKIRGIQLKIIAFIFMLLADIGFSKTIHVYTTIYPPYVIKTQKPELEGFTVEVLNRAFKKAGYETKYYVSPYKRAVQSFKKNKESTIIGPLFSISDNKQLELSEIAFQKFPIAFFYNSKIHSEYGQMTDLKQLKGKLVGVLRGSGAYEHLPERFGAKTHSFTNEKQLLHVLAAGRIDIALTNEVTFHYHVSNSKKLNELRTINIALPEFNSGIVFDKQAFKAKDAFKEAVSEMSENGELLEIVSKLLSKHPKSLPLKIVPKKIRETFSQEQVSNKGK